MDDLVYRLRKRAEIRRQIPDRKSVQEGKPDRISDLLEEAADYIEKRDNSSWVGLSDVQVEEIANYHGIDGLYETSRIDFYRAIEITLKELNNG